MYRLNHEAAAGAAHCPDRRPARTASARVSDKDVMRRLDIERRIEIVAWIIAVPCAIASLLLSHLTGWW